MRTLCVAIRIGAFHDFLFEVIRVQVVFVGLLVFRFALAALLIHLEVLVLLTVQMFGVKNVRE